MLAYIQIRSRERQRIVDSDVHRAIYDRYKAEICAVCLEPLLSDILPKDDHDDSLNITVLRCGHAFHSKEECLPDRVAKCPKCRASRPALVNGRRAGENTGGGKGKRKIKRSNRKTQRH